MSDPEVEKQSLDETDHPKDTRSQRKLKVLIAGAGLGGLTLVILLMKPDIPFLVLESAKDIRSLGNASCSEMSTPMSFVSAIHDALTNKYHAGSALVVQGYLTYLQRVGLYVTALTLLLLRTLRMTSANTSLLGQICVTSCGAMFPETTSNSTIRSLHLSKTMNQRRSSVRMAFHTKGIYLSELMVHTPRFAASCTRFSKGQNALHQ